MPPKTIPLWEIERSIAINCVLDKNSNKPLQLAKKKWQGLGNQGIARCVFLYIAMNAGYTQEEICDYLTMNDQEFHQKREILTDLYNNGKLQFEAGDQVTPSKPPEYGHTASYQATKDAYLFFYRKLVLAQNYLRYRFGD